MPQRNTVKEYAPESYYHVYNRGVNKADIFLDEQDYTVFLNLIKRYLGKDVEKKTNRLQYENYYDKIELLAFCLMPNHFHLFIYQSESRLINEVMKRVCVTYSMYFNNRYGRVGTLMQQRYKAVKIDDDAQLLHISRYIHMNPTNYKSYEWSSLPYYMGMRSASWLRAERAIGLFPPHTYMSFLDEYRSKRAELKYLKHSLADA